MKDEPNRCYNGGGKVYVLKRELSRSSLEYTLGDDNDSSRFSTYTFPPPL